MLSDSWPHGAVAQKLGLFREKDGFSESANLLLDEKGKVMFIKVYPIPQLPPIEEIFDFLRKE